MPTPFAKQNIYGNIIATSFTAKRFAITLNALLNNVKYLTLTERE